jgi:hypothetical protein
MQMELHQKKTHKQVYGQKNQCYEAFPVEVLQTIQLVQLSSENLFTSYPTITETGRVSVFLFHSVAVV